MNVRALAGAMSVAALVCGCSQALDIVLENQTNEQIQVLSDHKTSVAEVGKNARIYYGLFSLDRHGCHYSYEPPTRPQLQQEFSAALTKAGVARDLDKIVLRLTGRGEIDIVQINDVVLEVHAQSTGVAHVPSPLSPKSVTCQNK
jgi:hypothetical protein